MSAAVPVTLSVNETFFSIQGEGTRAGQPCVFVRLTGCPLRADYEWSRPEFYRAYQEVVDLGTRPETRIRIVTPVIGLSKAEIVRQGQALEVPFEMTWSCYQSQDVACGACESCRLRLRGFAEAGVSDPLPYRAPRP